MYHTVVKGIGAAAQAFEEEKMVILFGDNAPQELADYCYVIDKTPVTENITTAQSLYIDDIPYIITEVGSAVTKNLNDLGHITLKFDGSTTVEQSGTLYLEDQPYTIKVGSTLEIK